MTGNLKSILRNRLRTHRNKKFVAMVKEKYPHLDLHHLLGSKLGGHKINDYLLVPKNHEQHISEHYSVVQTEEQYLADFLVSLEIIFDILDEVIK